MNKERYKGIEEEIENYDSTIVAKDFECPWGLYLVIKEDHAQDFAN